GAGGVVAPGEVEVVVVLDLGAGDDLVELAVVAGMLEVDGDHGPHRRSVGHLDQDAAGRDVAGHGERVAVQLAADHDQERLIEPGMDALLDDGDRDGGEAAIFEDMSERHRFAALHNCMIGGPLDEVKELTLSYIEVRTGYAHGDRADSRRALGRYCSRVAGLDGTGGAAVEQSRV